MRARVGPAACLALLVVVAGCTTGAPSPAPSAATSAGSMRTSPTTTGAGCPPTALSGGPVTSQVVVVTTSDPSATAGSALAVRTEIVVLSDAPDVLARPQWSALEVLTRDGVVARAVGSAGSDVPTSLHRGTTVAAPTVPTAITLTGCDGHTLSPGSYYLRALVGYAGSATGSNGSNGYAMRSEPVELTIT